MVPAFVPERQRLARWRRMRVWAAAHAVDDFYQGLVPEVVPYFVLERHYSYVGASGLAMAATLGSALPQLAIGVLADRRRLRWMSPLGLSLAGTGAGLASVVPSACDHKVAALPLIALTGLVTNIPFAVLVKLGQDYLPTGWSSTAVTW